MKEYEWNKRNKKRGEIGGMVSIMKGVEYEMKDSREQIRNRVERSVETIESGKHEEIIHGINRGKEEKDFRVHREISRSMWTHLRDMRGKEKDEIGTTTETDGNKWTRSHEVSRRTWMKTRERMKEMSTENRKRREAKEGD